MTIGWKAMFWKSGEQPSEKMVCPECKLSSKFTHRARMYWFHILGIPLFPVSGKRRMYKCGYCTTEFDAARIDIAKSQEVGTLVGGEKAAEA